MLESAVARSEMAPETFLIPGAGARRLVRPGQGVKLLFWIKSEDEQIPICERMWVLVEEQLQDGRYVGSLANVPETAGNLSKGTRLVFGSEHIADVDEGPIGAPGSDVRT
jgi:hypothetical protein